jgi:DNA topoisomerase IB
VNHYLRAATRREFTAKDFRTWKATAMVLAHLHQRPANSITAARQAVAQALREAAEALGNTVTVCRQYYVHPQVIELFLGGRLAAVGGRTIPRPAGRLAAYERLCCGFSGVWNARISVNEDPVRHLLCGSFPERGKSQ